MVGLSDLKGLDALVAHIRKNIIEPLKQGIENTSKNMLIYGPPGCGKTYIAKLIAQELDLDVRILKESDDILEKVSGANDKTMLFFDLCEKTCTDEILASIPKDVFVVGGTNKPWEIKETIAGRFTSWIFLGEPSDEARKEIISQKLADKVNDHDIDKLVELTRGYTPQEIYSILYKSEHEDLEMEFRQSPPADVENWKVEVFLHESDLDRERFRPLFEWIENS